jgi:hypothetical protein
VNEAFAYVSGGESGESLVGVGVVALLNEFASALFNVVDETAFVLFSVAVAFTICAGSPETRFIVFECRFS